MGRGGGGGGSGGGGGGERGGGGGSGGGGGGAGELSQFWGEVELLGGPAPPSLDETLHDGSDMPSTGSSVRMSSLQVR